MLISEPKTIYDAVKPLVYFNCLVGLGAFRLPNLSNTIYLSMKVHTVAINILNSIMIYFTFNSLTEVLDFDNIEPLAVTMHKILISANSSIAVIAPLLLWLRRKALRDCVQQIAILNDYTFKSVLKAQNKYKEQYIRLLYQIGAIFLVMFSVGISNTALSLKIVVQMEIQSVFVVCSVAQALHNPILVMLLLDVNFCTFVGYLGKKFRDMNDSLLQLKGKPPTLFPRGRRLIITQNVGQSTIGNEVKNTEVEGPMNDTFFLLREIRREHLGLSKLSRKINLAFGMQNLLSSGVSFAMITGLLYTIYSGFSSQNFTITSELIKIIPSVSWTAIYAFKIWLVNHSCWSVSNEAEKTGEVIYELLSSKVDKELEHEIHEFGVQMLQNPIEFNACGFFTLHHTFVQGVIGSITTYLVILIQMSDVSEVSIPDTRTAENSTFRIEASPN